MLTNVRITIGNIGEQPDRGKILVNFLTSIRPGNNCGSTRPRRRPTPGVEADTAMASNTLHDEALRDVPKYRDTLRSSVQKTAEPIEMPFRVCARIGPRHHVLDGSRSPNGMGRFWGKKRRIYQLVRR